MAGLDQNHVPRPDVIAQRGNERVAAFKVRAAHDARGFTCGQQQGGAAECVSADFAVHVLAVLAQVQHVAENADQTAGQVGGGVYRQIRRVGVGVVAVVDYGYTAGADNAGAVSDRLISRNTAGDLPVAQSQLNADRRAARAALTR